MPDEPKELIPDDDKAVKRSGAGLSPDTIDMLKINYSLSKAFYPDREKILEQLKRHSLGELISLSKFLETRWDVTTKKAGFVQDKLNMILERDQSDIVSGKIRSHPVALELKQIIAKIMYLRYKLEDVENLIENYEEIQIERAVPSQKKRKKIPEYQVAQEKFERLQRKHKTDSKTKVLWLLAGLLGKSVEATRRLVYYKPKKVTKIVT